MKKKMWIIMLCTSTCILTSCAYNANNNQNTNIENNEAYEETNDFFKVLDGIKSTHPGTAGCSLQVLYDANDLLNICKTKLPFEPMASSWIENNDKNDYADIKESFEFLQEYLHTLKDGDDKKILDENDVPNDAPYDKALYDTALNITQHVIDLTK